MSMMQEFPVDDAGHPIGCEEDVLAARWTAMHQAADAIARMLGRDGSGAERVMSLYPVGLPDGDVLIILAETEDLCTMMTQGLFAILRARENGAEAKVAAKALLSRFERKRHALLAGHETPQDLAA
ncbi:hypothetical protein EKN06_06730 [Croceicoccus ponticola]|uniref:Uncharacterized protein n=1 Tax=Croceicoccus ponticola TaxID=2217664 RepID=A0A437GY67_9SPHN|nr:hypothetical protein [Croceicoccus ponticola]RVQ67634.1 hypothetical protein EKN06_06730 [Croceicoccus ponticola]